MILIINVCAEKLHYYEFVKPIEEILRSADLKFFTKHYLEINSSDLKKADKVIICGTSIKDNHFIEEIDRFSWIKTFEGSILGICAGFQVLGLIHGGVLKKDLEIGFFHEELTNAFLGEEGEIEVYHLHNNYVNFSRIQEFEVYSVSKISQAVKHLKKEQYGVLFHPEVRQKGMILNFANG